MIDLEEGNGDACARKTLPKLMLTPHVGSWDTTVHINTIATCPLQSES